MERITELDDVQDQDTPAEEDPDAENPDEGTPDAEAGKKQEDSDAEDLMNFTEGPDADDSTTPTDGEEQVPAPVEAEECARVLDRGEEVHTLEDSEPAC